MLKPGILTKVRKWITTDKTVSETGKWIADAKSIKDLADAVRRIVPIGTIISLMGNSAPTDYLKCDGSTYNIADYSELADYFYAQFGSKNFFGGDGSTTFKVPDLRGEFLRGTGTNGHSGEGNGGTVGAHQEGSTVASYYVNNGNQMEVYGNNTGLVNFIDATSQPYSHSIVFSGTQTAVKGIICKIRPTNTSVLYCIKYI